VCFSQASWKKELENPASVSSITISFGSVVGVALEVDVAVGANVSSDVEVGLGAGL
jgi:hypothetical protein